jgi:hypothetical protein
MLGVSNLTNMNLTMDNPQHLIFNTFYVNNTMAQSGPEQQSLGSISFINCFMAWGVGPEEKRPAATVAAIVVPIVVVAVLGLALGGLLWYRKRRAFHDKDLSSGKEAIGLDGVVVDGCKDVKFDGCVDSRTGTGTKLAVVGYHEESVDNSVNSDSRNRSKSGPSQDIQEACRHIVGTRVQTDTEPIHLDGVLGEGSYGKVSSGEIAWGMVVGALGVLQALVVLCSDAKLGHLEVLCEGCCGQDVFSVIQRLHCEYI